MSELNDDAISKLSIVERVKLKKLPEYWTRAEIVELYIYFEPETSFLKQALIDIITEAWKTGELDYEGDLDETGWSYLEGEPNPYPLARAGDHHPRSRKQYGNYSCTITHCTSHHERIKLWLQKLEGFPVKNFLAGCWTDAQTVAGRLNKQITFICKTGEELEYDLLDIPRGGRAIIKSKCLEYSNKVSEDGLKVDADNLFTISSFDHAWNETNERGITRVQNKEIYTQKK